MSLSHGATGRSVIYEFGISWSHSFLVSPEEQRSAYETIKSQFSDILFSNKTCTIYTFSSLVYSLLTFLITYIFTH